MTRLPDSRRAISGRTHSQPWRACDYDPIRAYKGGGGLAWRLFCALACFVALAVIGLLLAWRG